MRHITGVRDLDEAQLDRVIARADDLVAVARVHRSGVSRSGPRLAGLFLTPSMRTRVGFEVAAQRLGGSSFRVDELRIDPKMSAAESLADAVRVIAGMVDVVVVRTNQPLSAVLSPALPSPVINGGDAHEHPSQAIIDLAAIQRFAGEPSQLHIALCGDLRMRAATSLLALLARRPPRVLSLMHPEGRGPLLMPPPGVRARRADPDQVQDVDVLIMIGLPAGEGSDFLDAGRRAHFMLDEQRLSRMREDAIVLSPMPMIDEISPSARTNPRIRMFEQSDHAVFVRMALLEWVLAEAI